MSRVRKVITLSIGQGAGILATLGITIVLSRLFTKEDYATYRQTLLAFEFAAPFLMLALPQAMLYFLPISDTREEQNRHLVSNLVLLAILGALLSVFLTFGGNHFLAQRFDNPDLVKTLLLYSPVALFLFPASSFSATMIAYDREKTVLFFSFVSKILLFISVVAVVWWSGSVYWAVGAFALVSTAGAMASIVIMLRQSGWSLPKPELGLFKQHLVYAVPLGVGTMLGALNKGLDKIIVASMCSEQDFAVYVNGAFEIPLLALLTGQIGAVLQPELAKAAKSGSLEEVHGTWSRATSKAALIIFPVTAFGVAFSEEIVTVLFSSAYSASSEVFLVYTLVLPMRVIQFGAIFAAMAMGKLVIYRAGLTLILNGVLSVWLVKQFGMIGAAYATIGVTVIFVLPYCLYFSGKWFRRPVSELLDYRALFKVAIVAIVTVAVIRCVETFCGFEQVFVTLITACAAYGVIVLAIYAKFFGLRKILPR